MKIFHFVLLLCFSVLALVGLAKQDIASRKNPPPGIPGAMESFLSACESYGPARKAADAVFVETTPTVYEDVIRIDGCVTIMGYQQCGTVFGNQFEFVADPDYRGVLAARWMTAMLTRMKEKYHE